MYWVPQQENGAGSLAALVATGGQGWPAWSLQSMLLRWAAPASSSCVWFGRSAVLARGPCLYAWTRIAMRNRRTLQRIRRGGDVSCTEIQGGGELQLQIRSGGQDYVFTSGGKHPD